MTHNQDLFLIELKTPLTVPFRAWVIAASAAVLGDAQHNSLQNQGPPAPGEGQGKGRGQQERSSATFTVFLRPVLPIQRSAI